MKKNNNVEELLDYSTRHIFLLVKNHQIENKLVVECCGARSAFYRRMELAFGPIKKRIILNKVSDCFNKVSLLKLGLSATLNLVLVAKTMIKQCLNLDLVA